MDQQIVYEGAFSAVHPMADQTHARAEIDLETFHYSASLELGNEHISEMSTSTAHCWCEEAIRRHTDSLCINVCTHECVYMYIYIYI